MTKATQRHTRRPRRWPTEVPETPTRPPSPPPSGGGTDGDAPPASGLTLDAASQIAPEATAEPTPTRRPRGKATAKPRPADLDTGRPSAWQSTELRETELIGLTDDGRMVLWQTGMVKPVNAFKTHDNGRWIDSGHYVIDWHGHAITVHCGNCSDDSVSVQFMCNAGPVLRMARAQIERRLLGKVIPDPVAQAKILKMLKEMGTEIAARNDTPDRQRGHI